MYRAKLTKHENIMALIQPTVCNGLSSLRIQLLLIVIAAITFSSEVNADQPQNEIRFGVMALSPYGFIDKNNKSHGNLFEISQVILKHGGFQGDSVILPLKRLTQSILNEGKLDCVIYGKVPFVVEHYEIVEPIGIDVNFGVLPRKGVVIDSYSDLKNLTIGVPLGVKMGGGFDKDDTLNIVPATNYESGMQMLKHQRLDAIAGVISSLQFSGKKNDITSDAYGTPFVIRKLPFVVSCRPQFLNDNLKSRLRSTIVELRENGTFERIYNKYLY